MLIVGIMIFSLCSCVSLQGIKDRQAFWKDAVHSSILWGEKEFMHLPDAEEGALSPTYDEERNIYVTDAEVPALLSGSYGAYARVSDDDIFLLCAGEIYCRTDRYREIARRLAQGFVPESNGYDYFDEEYNDHFYIFTEAENEVLLNLLETVQGWPVKTYPEDYQYVCSVYQCSKDGLFKEYYADLVRSGDRYYFEYQMKDLWEGDQFVLCQVPDEDVAKVKALFDKALENYFW